MKYLSCLLTLLVFDLNALAGEFINLNFEQANLTGSLLEYRAIPELGRFPITTNFPFGTGSTDQLLPGWSVSYGRYLPDNSIAYDPVTTISIGNGFIDSPNQGPQPGHAGLIIPGDYVNILSYDGFALVLDDTARFAGLSPAIMRVTQVGTVPLDAQMLSFRLPESAFSLSLLVDGGSYAVTSLPQDPADFRRYLFDIAPWAGKDIELGFATAGGLYYVVDDITFVIPEPTTVSLLLMGGAALGFTIWKRTRRF